MHTMPEPVADKLMKLFENQSHNQVQSIAGT